MGIITKAEGSAVKEGNLEGEVLGKSDMALDLPKKMSELNFDGWVGVKQLKEEWRESAGVEEMACAKALWLELPFVK